MKGSSSRALPGVLAAAAAGTALPMSLFEEEERRYVPRPHSRWAPSYTSRGRGTPRRARRQTPRNPNGRAARRAGSR